MGRAGRRNSVGGQPIRPAAYAEAAVFEEDGGGSLYWIPRYIQIEEERQRSAPLPPPQENAARLVNDTKQPVEVYDLRVEKRGNRSAIIMGAFGSLQTILDGPTRIPAGGSLPVRVVWTPKRRDSNQRSRQKMSAVDQSKIDKLHEMHPLGKDADDYKRDDRLKVVAYTSLSNPEMEIDIVLNETGSFFAAASS